MQSRHMLPAFVVSLMFVSLFMVSAVPQGNNVTSWGLGFVPTASAQDRRGQAPLDQEDESLLDLADRLGDEGLDEDEDDSAEPGDGPDSGAHNFDPPPVTEAERDREMVDQQVYQQSRSARERVKQHREEFRQQQLAQQRREAAARVKSKYAQNSGQGRANKASARPDPANRPNVRTRGGSDANALRDDEPAFSDDEDGGDPDESDVGVIVRPRPKGEAEEVIEKEIKAGPLHAFEVQRNLPAYCEPFFEGFECTGMSYRYGAGFSSNASCDRSMQQIAQCCEALGDRCEVSVSVKMDGTRPSRQACQDFGFRMRRSNPCATADGRDDVMRWLAQARAQDMRTKLQQSGVELTRTVEAPPQLYDAIGPEYRGVTMRLHDKGDKLYVVEPTPGTPGSPGAPGKGQWLYAGPVVQGACGIGTGGCLGVGGFELLLPTGDHWAITAGLGFGYMSEGGTQGVENPGWVSYMAIAGVLFEPWSHVGFYADAVLIEADLRLTLTRGHRYVGGQAGLQVSQEGWAGAFLRAGYVGTQDSILNRAAQFVHGIQVSAGWMF